MEGSVDQRRRMEGGGHGREEEWWRTAEGREVWREVAWSYIWQTKGRQSGSVL